MANMGIDSGFWKEKKVLITGHTGFKGSWLCMWLKDLGARVVGYSLEPPTEPNLFEMARISEGIESVHGDVRDLPAIKGVLEEQQPDVVVHMAAQSLVRRSYLMPVETFSTNVMGTVNILEALRHVPSVRSAVIVTSDKCYENRDRKRGYSEDDRMGGYDAYSASKGCAELVVAAYCRSYFGSDSNMDGVGIASARAGNVIGGGDWAEDRLLPDFFRSTLGGSILTVRAPSSIRPWQYVLEPLRGYILLAQALWDDPKAFSGGWNFGPETDSLRKVSDVIEMACRMWGESAEWKTEGGAGQPHEALTLSLNCAKANRQLGWIPSTKLEDAVRMTVDWFRAYNRSEDMAGVSLGQIRNYAHLCR
jgi:CDP-glucose 4,6-dehydratase